MKLPKIENASKDIVDVYHKKYIDQLCKLFDRYKGRFGITEDLSIN